MVLILVLTIVTSVTRPIIGSPFTALIVSPIWKGLVERISIPAIALLIVLFEANPMMVPAAKLIAAATVPLTVENCNIIMVPDATIIIDFTTIMNPFNSPFCSFHESVSLPSANFII